MQVDEGIPPNSGGTPLPVEDYAYDAEGNRTASHLSAFYASNDHNQLLEDDGFTYAYDAKGNRVSKTSKATGDVETYTYDSQNRLVGYQSPTTVASYAYDAFGRRVAKTVGTTIHAMINDQIDLEFPASQRVALRFRDGELVQRTAFSNWIDEPISMERYSGNDTPGTGSIYDYFADELGSIRRLVDVSTGNVVASSDYNSFGVQVQNASSLFQYYGFAGREADDESDLYHYRARYFDPQTGTFISTDSLGFASGTANLYSYADNDPVNFTDPTGHKKARARAISLADAEQAIIMSGMAATTGVAVAQVYSGLLDGPLSSIQDGFNQIAVMMASGSGTGTGADSNGDGPGNCGPGGPDPSRWQRFKEAFRQLILALPVALGAAPDIVNPTPNLEDMPLKSIERSMRDMRRWNEEARRLEDLYENAPDGSDDGDDEGGNC